MAKTAKELAKELNISQAAVSLALNNMPGVSEETRERVRAAAQQAGIKGRSTTRRLESFTSCIHYVIYIKHGSAVRETTFHSIVLQGIEAQCKKLGYSVQLSYFYENNSWAEQLRAISHSTSGIVLLGTEIVEGDTDKFKALGIPIVVVDNSAGFPDFDCVVNDGEIGAFAAVKYLLARNHVNIWYLSSQQKINNFLERERGVARALASDNRTAGREMQIKLVDLVSDNMLASIDRIVSTATELPTAIFADNDLIAANAVRIFKNRGFRIPEDISVIGYDDLPVATYVNPPLTTVQVQKEKMGETAVQILHNRITDPSEPITKITLLPPILERKSVLAL